MVRYSFGVGLSHSFLPCRFIPALPNDAHRTTPDRSRTRAPNGMAVHIEAFLAEIFRLVVRTSTFGRSMPAPPDADRRSATAGVTDRAARRWAGLRRRGGRRAAAPALHHGGYAENRDGPESTDSPHVTAGKGKVRTGVEGGRCWFGRRGRAVRGDLSGPDRRAAQAGPRGLVGRGADGPCDVRRRGHGAGLTSSARAFGPRWCVGRAVMPSAGRRVRHPVRVVV